MGVLIHCKPGGDRFIFPMGDGVIIIGRDSKSDLLLKSVEVSRNHASIVLVNGKYTIRDNGSQNGTLVNGNKITQAVLSHNDKISFGPYEFLVDLVSVPSREANSSQNKIHVVRGEQNYKSSLTLPKLKGHDGKEQSVELIMSEKVRRGASSQPVPKPSGTFNLLISAVLAAIILWTLWLSYLGHESSYNLARLKTDSESQIDLLKKSMDDLKNTNLLLKEDFQKATAVLTSDLARLSKDVSSITDSSTPASEQSAPAAETNNSDSEQSKTSGDANDTASKVASSSTNPSSPGSDSPSASETKSLDHNALAKEMGIPLFEPQLLLLFPKKVSLNQELKVPFFIGNNVKAFRTIPPGQPLVVQTATEDSLQITLITGETVTIPKDATDFSTSLETANAEIRKSNDEKLKSWQETVEKCFQELNNARTRISIVVRDIWENQIRGMLVSDGTSVYVSGLDTTKLVSDQRWNGSVYLLGYKSNLSKRYRVYTISAQEFVSSKTSQSGANEMAKKIDQLENSEKPNVKFDDLKKIYEMSDPLESIRNLRSILDSKKSNADYELKKFCQDEHDKWINAYANVTELSKNKTMKLGIKEWLKQVAMCAELNVPERARLFLENLVRMDRLWVEIKVTHETSSSNEDNPDSL